MMRRVSIAIAWGTSESTVNFTPAPHASTMLQTMSKITAHSVVVTTQLVPNPLHPLRPIIPLLPWDQSTWYPLLWQTDFPLPLLDEPFKDLVIPMPPLHVFTPPPFDSVVFVLLPQVPMMTMSMTPMPGGTSTVIEIFQQCFNATMGVMLQLPISFFIPLTYAFLLYHDWSTVQILLTTFLLSCFILVAFDLSVYF